MLNPNYIYSVVFLFVFAIYQLRWSDLYPPLGYLVLVFLLITIAANFIMGYFLSKSNFIKYKKPKITDSSQVRVIIITIFLLLLLIIDKALGDIPTVHIILITFTSFFNCYIFTKYLHEKKKIQLLIFLILFLTSAILITVRILIFFNLITSLLTYIYIKNPFKTLKGKILITSLIIILFYIFGALGNNIKGHDTGKVILIIGEATDEFTNSFMPDEYFWTYLYASSPLANLELNIKYKNSIQPTLHGYLLWIVSEFLPDFISKKIFASMDEKQLIGIQINPALNVSTVYLRSYRYASWYGLTAMALVIIIFPAIYLYVIRNSKYFITGIVTISTLYMFLIFDNIFAFSPLSFQLVYPFLGILRVKWNVSKNVSKV